MAKLTKVSEAVEPKEDVKSPEPKFSGIARSVEAFDNQGFRNFRILTLHLQDDRVIKIERSDPYASFEAIAKMELWNELSVYHLNTNWAPGKTLSK